jgi:hypothetical protein
MEGILRCSRYSFGPNRLHYCGPDANAELHDYIDSGGSDPGLSQLLQQFQTLYPYLQHIARANDIIDPFDARVVEAYWLGNALLENVGKQKLHRFLIDDLGIKDKLPSKDFSWLEEKIGQGAVPHHSFHVMNIWRRTGNMDVPHTLESMDECRVSAGSVTAVSGPSITVTYEPLIYQNGKLALGAPVEKKLTRQLEAEYDIEQIKPGALVSIHWSVPCEVITKEQAMRLRTYTLKNIAFANQTI